MKVEKQEINLERLGKSQIPRFLNFSLLFKNKVSVCLFLMSSSDDEMEPLYEVEKILNKRFNSKGRPQYYIKWKGYAQKTWEPIQHLSTIPDLIFEFEQKEQDLRKKKRSVPRASKSICKSQFPSAGRTGLYLNKNMQKKSKLRFKKNSKVQLQLSSSSEDENHDQFNEKDMPCIQGVQSSEEVEEAEPVVKHYTEVSDDDCDYPAPENPKRQGNICHDIVKQIHQIQEIDGKWMAEVEFESSRFDKSWHERDIVRLLYPYQLLVYYEKLAKQRKYQLY